MEGKIRKSFLPQENNQAQQAAGQLMVEGADILVFREGAPEVRDLVGADIVGEIALDDRGGIVHLQRQLKGRGLPPFGVAVAA